MKRSGPRVAVLFCIWQESVASLVAWSNISTLQVSPAPPSVHVMQEALLHLPAESDEHGGDPRGQGRRRALTHQQDRHLLLLQGQTACPQPTGVNVQTIRSRLYGVG